MADDTPTKLTPFQAKALRIVLDHESKGLTPSWFADLMWPDSLAHKRMSNCGINGASMGKGIVYAAGGHLAKLARKGILDRVWDEHGFVYYVSQLGRGLLTKAEA